MKLKDFLQKRRELKKLISIYKRFKEYTMIPQSSYLCNLKIANLVKDIEGDIVECGVWKGGMIAGIATMLGKHRTYYLYDSFEGLPEAKSIDGDKAVNWQKDKSSPIYFDNCKADIQSATEVMNLTGVTYKCIKGWFHTTIPVSTHDKISLLRLDGDWYESTMTCLEYLYPKVVKEGIVLIDDYFAWDGCSRAVHDYLSKIQSKSRIRIEGNRLAYIIKEEQA